MEQNRPLIPVNPKGLDDIASALLNAVPDNNNDSSGSGDFPSGRINIRDPEKYLFLPGKSHGNYNYSNTLISLERVHNGKNWFDTHKLLAVDKAYMPTIRQFVDFVKELKSGKALNGKGQKISGNIVQSVLDDIFKLGNYRGRWLDADFKVVGDKLHINYNHTVNPQGQIVYGKSEPLISSTLMTDRHPGIKLDDWINRATNQGLPPTDTENGDIWYWNPRSDNNSVARFSADSGRAYLDCGRYPTLTNSSLGVH
ncbi:MAG: hypothetical protein AABX85_00505, partial [Nanoarchaeota archaeon]